MSHKTSYPTRNNQLIETFDAVFMRKPCIETRQAVVVPQQGQVLIFEHQQLHEGAPVTSGIKYVLRTDVMYKHRFAQ